MQELANFLVLFSFFLPLFCILAHIFFTRICFCVPLSVRVCSLSSVSYLLLANSLKCHSSLISWKQAGWRNDPVSCVPFESCFDISSLTCSLKCIVWTLCKHFIDRELLCFICKVNLRRSDIVSLPLRGRDGEKHCIFFLCSTQTIWIWSNLIDLWVSVIKRKQTVYKSTK